LDPADSGSFLNLPASPPVARTGRWSAHRQVTGLADARSDALRTARSQVGQRRQDLCPFEFRGRVWAVTW